MTALGIPHFVPFARTPTQKLAPIGFCIYCRRSPPEVALTDEHIIADGLGGDVVLPAASCKSCAAKTSRAELHLLREVLQYMRSIVGVSSRKRKSQTRTVKVHFEGDPEGVETEYVLDGDAPFIFPFLISDDLPGILRGVVREPVPTDKPLLRIGLFGPQDWNQRALKWLEGKKGSFKWGNRVHAGIVAQAMAKTAHAYTCATIGTEAFAPFLTDLILSDDPCFDPFLIGSYPTHGYHDALHMITLNAARVLRRTFVGTYPETVYVVGLRLFTHQPGPAFLIVVGRVVGKVAERVRWAEDRTALPPPPPDGPPGPARP